MGYFASTNESVINCTKEDSSPQNLYKMTLIVTYLVSLISTSGLNWRRIMSAKSSFNAKFKSMLLQKWLDCDLTRKIEKSGAQKVAIIFTRDFSRQIARNNTNIKWFNDFFPNELFPNLSVHGNSIRFSSNSIKCLSF